MRVRFLAAATSVVALIAASPAAAWTPVSTGPIENIVDPGVLVTKAGTELVTFDNSTLNTISLSRAGGAPRVLVSGDPIAGNSRLVQQPSGAIQLYFPNGSGVARLTSTDDGQTWSGPVQTLSLDVGPVVSAAVRADGTPLFSQDGTGFVNIFQGLGGEQIHNAFPHCCGYGESLAVDSTGLASVAFWQNSTSPNDYVYEPLDSSGAPGTPTSFPATGETVPNNSRTPSAADGLGNTFMAWTPGYPTQTGLMVGRFRGGSFKGSVSPYGVRKGNIEFALTVGASNRLWVAWTSNGKLYAARSRTAGVSFGATVNMPLPAGSTAYQLEALSPASGELDAFVNFGDSIKSQHLLPGLSATPSKKGSKMQAKITDNTFPVAGAKAKAAGLTLTANSKGIVDLAGLRKGVPVIVSAAGYVGTKFRVP